MLTERLLQIPDEESMLGKSLSALLNNGDSVLQSMLSNLRNTGDFNDCQVGFLCLAPALSPAPSVPPLLLFVCVCRTWKDASKMGQSFPFVFPWPKAGRTIVAFSWRT